MKIIIPKIKSLPVTSVDQIQEDASEMQFALERGDFESGPFNKGSIALHHSQVSENPYNFFVVKQSIVGAKPNEIIAIINPEIIEVDESSRKNHLEGCISFPFRHDKKVIRHNRVKVRYQVIENEGKTFKKCEEWAMGLMAMVFQHEIDHANAKHIYQETNSKKRKK